MPIPASDPPPLTLDHPFDLYTYDDRVFCVHVEVRGDTGQTCGRPESEHPLPEVGGEPVEDGEGLRAGGSGVQ